MGKLQGKRILVAGSARNIGAKTAQRLVEEGAQVFLGDVDAEQVKAVADQLGAGSQWFDLADQESLENLVSAAVKHLGGLDGIANIAADISPDTIGKDVDLLGMDTAIWEKMLNSNLVGYALLIKHALPHLIESGSGSIVNISSGSYFAGEPTRPAYAAAKAGVNTLTRHVASRWGKDNIRCNAISPGMIVTETAGDLVSEEYMSKILRGVPLPRLGESKDIANGIVFFLSDEAEWITGQVLNINGGSAFRD